MLTSGSGMEVLGRGLLAGSWGEGRREEFAIRWWLKRRDVGIHSRDWPERERVLESLEGRLFSLPPLSQYSSVDGADIIDGDSLPCLKRPPRLSISV